MVLIITVIKLAFFLGLYKVFFTKFHWMIVGLNKITPYFTVEENFVALILGMLLLILKTQKQNK